MIADWTESILYTHYKTRPFSVVLKCLLCCVFREAPQKSFDNKTKTVAFAKNSGTRGRTIDPQTYRPRLRGVISLLKISATLLETRIEESFLSGINFYFLSTSILCACFLCHRRHIFLVPPLRYRFVSFY